MGSVERPDLRDSAGAAGRTRCGGGRRRRRTRAWRADARAAGRAAGSGRRSSRRGARRVSMDKFKKLRKMYNDAGVTIYAWKQLNPNMSDEEFEYIFNVAEALGCTHTTLELPDGRTPRAAQAHRRLRDEEEDLRRVSHARAGQHDGLRPGVRAVEGQHGERRLRPLRRGRQRRRHADAVPARSTTIASPAST